MKNVEGEERELKELIIRILLRRQKHGCYLAKYGVLVVEVRLRCIGDKELRPIGVWAVVCH